MSTKPSLLCFGTNVSVPASVLADLQITDKSGLLSEYARQVLLHPCGKAEMENRQELFRWLEDHAHEEALSALLSALRDYARTVGFEKENKNPIEKVYLRLRMMRQYTDTGRLFAGFSDCGVLLSGVSEYYSAPKKWAMYDEIGADCHAVEKILSSIRTFLLSFADKNWITPDDGAVSLSEKVASCAAKLSLAVPKVKESHGHPDLSLCDAYFRLFADEMRQVDALFSKHSAVDWEEPLGFIPELSFFLEIRVLTRRAESLMVPYCFPQLSSERQLTAERLYDISLLSKECQSIVPNDTWFSEKEPFFFMTGANGGGKTTYLRAVGINLLLALSGCPVFAGKMTVYPFDGVLTHFPKDERFTDSGRLDEELTRVRQMLEESSDTFLLFNETFSGTDDKRGFSLLCDTTAKIKNEKRFGLYVTHFHEAENIDIPVLSAEVDEDNGNHRTFRIVRKGGKNSSYAADILKKYHLDRESLAERRQKNGI